MFASMIRLSFHVVIVRMCVLQNSHITSVLHKAVKFLCYLMPFGDQIALEIRAGMWKSCWSFELFDKHLY